MTNDKSLEQLQSSNVKIGLALLEIHRLAPRANGELAFGQTLAHGPHIGSYGFLTIER